MQNKYEEKIKALCAENEIILQEIGGKVLVPSTLTLQGSTKQHEDEPDRTVQASSFGTSKDKNHCVVTINTIGMLPFVARIMETPLSENLRMPMFDK